MPRRISLTCGMLAGVVLFGCGMPPAVRVMSFNIRYGTADDGANRWEVRQPFVLETIRAAEPDILAMQEVLAFQADELREQLSDYAFVGVGRDDGERAGEMAPIMFRKRRFSLVDGGHYWLSPQSDQPGSVGWDAALPRIVTWVRLKFSSHPLSEIYVLNTHFDHKGETARLESARLLRRVIESIGGQPVLLVGDFNCGPASAPYRVLTEEWRNAMEMYDAHAGRVPARGSGTYHGFQGTRDGERIDWILHNQRWRVLDADVDTRMFGTRFPSDHFPVAATVELVPVTRFGAM
ncbi:MAG: hypothetical protein CHACPFDD_01776 [Phycisphaerae bacterium]|nr:hypothetical protein [Phycisphaerae bacterium]